MYCNRTMVGFVQKIGGGDTYDKHTIRCFYGVLSEESLQAAETEEEAAPKESSSQAKLNETQKAQADKDAR